MRIERSERGGPILRIKRRKRGKYKNDKEYRDIEGKLKMMRSK
jgi:hypothetical protein